MVTVVGGIRVWKERERERRKEEKKKERMDGDFAFSSPIYCLSPALCCSTG